MIPDTQKEAWEHVKKGLNKRQIAVLDNLIEYGAAPRYEIARRMGVPINHITGRITELMVTRRVVVVGKVKNDKTGCLAEIIGFNWSWKPGEAPEKRERPTRKWLEARILKLEEENRRLKNGTLF